MQAFAGKFFNQTSNWLVVAVLLCVLGFIREYSYFHALGLEVSNYLEISHYIYEAGFILLIWFFTLVILVLPKKFLSKQEMQRDDWAEAVDLIKSKNFDEVFPQAQVVLFTTIGFWLFVVFEPYYFLGRTFSGLGIMYLMMIFYVVFSFIPPYIVGNQHAQRVLALVFFVAISLCMSAGAIDEAHRSSEKALKSKGSNTSIVVRDDKYIKITLENHKYVVRTLPIPFVDYVLKKIKVLS